MLMATLLFEIFSGTKGRLILYICILSTVVLRSRERYELTHRLTV